MPQPNEAPPRPENEVIDASQHFEQERMNRRAALKKLGITSVATVLGVFAADDFARMAIRVMEQNKATRQVAETLAHELKNAGVALASTTAGDRCYNQASTAYQICMNVAQSNYDTSSVPWKGYNLATAQAQCRADYQTNFKYCDDTYGPTSGT